MKDHLLRRIVMIVVCLFILNGSVARAIAQYAPDMTGVQLLDGCTRQVPDWVGFCHGYVQAIYDARDGIAGYDGANFICIPAGTTRSVIVSQVVEAILAEPEDALQANAAAVVFVAMWRLYPCP